MTGARRALTALLPCAAALGAAILPPAEADRRVAATALPAGEHTAGAGETPGLVLRLSEGAQEAAPVALVARPPAQPLPEAETRRVLDRLPPLASLPSEEPFARREDSPPPPRSGRTVATPFPPPSEAPPAGAPRSGPLEVLRRAPEGEVPLAPRLSVTFSQPMVDLTSHAELARGALAVRLQPEVPGEWRWVGTRTLVFEPAVRFAMATEYRARVPAGTRSAQGGTLAGAVAWSFGTPAPRVVARHPEGAATRREPVLFAAFDQRIDPAAVLATVRLRAAGSPVPLRLATEAERAADATVARLARQAEAGRWLAFVPLRALPQDAAVEVVVGPGTPSAEGPRTTGEPQSWSFRTFGAFRVRGHECGWGGRCAPFQPWRIETTNPVDPKTLRRERVQVDPELPGLKLEGWGNSIALRGLTKGRTTYRVRLSSEIRDVFGQPLEPAGALSFAVGPAEAALSGPSRDLVVLDPAGPRALPVYTVNQPTLRVRAYAVSPEDWPAWNAYRQGAWRDEAAVPPGRRVIDTIVKVVAAPDALVETRVDLTPALVDGLGQVALVVEPAARAPRERRAQAVRAWVQSTRLGLDAFADDEALVAWASSLADGHALADVAVSLLPGASARTDGLGLARLALGNTPAPLLVARLGRDVAFLPAQTSWWAPGTGWRKRSSGGLRFCVLDDRGMYRPGEEVRVKGWLRRLGAGPRGDVEPPPDGIGPIAWTLRDARGNEAGKGSAPLGGLGAFDLTLKLPATMALGSAQLQLDAGGAPIEGGRYLHRFEVQEFRRPEFEVAAAASEGPFTIGTHATVTVSAAYYAGGALPGAEVSWRVATTPAASARQTGTTSCSAASSRGGSRPPGPRSPSASRPSRGARTAPGATGCASTSSRRVPRGHATCGPRRP